MSDKCQNPRCGKINTYEVIRTGRLFWGRCKWCGFHTSSYPNQTQAERAIKGGEHYLGNGNQLRRVFSVHLSGREYAYPFQ